MKILKCDICGYKAVAEGRNNTKAFGFNARAEGMNGSVVITTIKTNIGDKKYKIKNLFLNQKEGMYKVD